MTIASLELDNLNLFNLNDEESAAVNGGVALALAAAIPATLAVAVEGLRNPDSTAREIITDQIIAAGIFGGGGALGAVASAILAGGPVTVSAASLGKSEK